MNKEQTNQMAEVMLAWCEGAQVGWKEPPSDTLKKCEDPDWDPHVIWEIMPEPHPCADCKPGDLVTVWNARTPLPIHVAEGTFCGFTRSKRIIIEQSDDEISHWKYGESA